MRTRTVVAALLAVAALSLAVVAALTPLRAGEIAELDAEARRLGEQWVAEGREELAVQSNVVYEQARDLEPPLEPFVALGGALLFGAAAVAAWPPRRRGDVEEAVTDGAVEPTASV